MPERPDGLTLLEDWLRGEGRFAAPPDQVIVNEYLPGQGISAHVDCRPCFGDMIASLSLGSPCTMRLQEVDGRRKPRGRRVSPTFRTIRLNG